ncbi:hypothetical protein N7491_001954 [Penicillium cf. griseofulvum]|nr:hypothetical protein N7491_001954 [Penicillium cf. griseofulvum]
MAIRYAKDQPEGFTNRIEKVAIIGAGGAVGRHLVDQLVKNGKHVVTAITRPSSTNKMPEGVEIARVDYASDDDTALVEVLRGQQVLLITMNVMAPPDTMIKLMAPPPKPGMVSPNRDRFIAEISRLGVSSYLFLVCNFWYEFSLGGGPDRFGFDFAKRTFTLFDDGDVPINTTTWPQCGRAIAKLLSLKELPQDENDKSPTLSQFKNRSTHVSSFRLTQRDMFESVKRVTKTTDADWTISQVSVAESFKEGQEGMKVHNWKVFVKMLYSRMFFANGDGDYESRIGLDNEALGLPVEDLDEATAEGIRMAENNEVPFSH